MENNEKTFEIKDADPLLVFGEATYMLSDPTSRHPA
jgi:hypothetical protein